MKNPLLDTEKIKSARKKKNLSIRQLAERAGVDKNTISRLEAGSAGISAETIYKVCEELEIPISEVFRDDVKHAFQIHPLLKEKYSNFLELEAAVSKLKSANDRGEVFEQFACLYFNYFKSLYQIEEIYRSADIPPNVKKYLKLAGKDSGVDGVIETSDGQYICYQVKYRQAGSTLTAGEVGTFYGEAERADLKCIFTNCTKVTDNILKKDNQFLILKDNLNSLGEDFFDWLYAVATGAETREKIKYEPRDYQKKMIEQVISGLDTYKRGKLLAACGTGKTFTALRINEEMQAERSLYVVPNLSLIKQTLESWIDQAREPFKFLCVCSDSTVTKDTNQDEISNSIVDIPVTTDANKIREFLEKSSDEKSVIFTTYQSLDKITESVKDTGVSFDLGFFDEAHRTAGTKDSTMFTLGMDDTFIPIDKRLYMTATERLVEPKIYERAEELKYKVYSMDDQDQYGPAFTSLTFREAIDRHIISDYKIVLACMRESAIVDLINKKRIVTSGDKKVDMQTLFKEVLLAKSMSELGIHKVVSYHSDIQSAQDFIQPEHGVDLETIITTVDSDIDPQKLYVDHVNGSMNASKRNEIFNDFVAADSAVLTNARCLTEGVNLPAIDGIFFADPKNSTIDIVQAIGRALRIDPDNPDKCAYIIVPLIIPDSVKEFKDIDPREFATLHSVIQAMREQDKILADKIDHLNLRTARGEGSSDPLDSSEIIVELGEDLNLKDFSDGLRLRIAEVNKDPEKINPSLIIENKPRKAGVKRGLFKTVGDYNVESYIKNIILKTLKKYPSKNVGLPKEEIQIDHNNISHCCRIGVLEMKNDKYYITDVGKAFLKSPEKAKEIFAEQCVKYSVMDPISKTPEFPYKFALKVLKEVRYITRFEFAYSLYITKDLSDAAVTDAAARIRYLRSTYPNLEILSEVNKRAVCDVLNAKFDTTLRYEDIWTSRTTVYNQFGYVYNHLKNIDGIIDPTSPRDAITLKPGADVIIDELLKDTA